MTNGILALDGINKSFGKKLVLEDVSLSLSKGEITTLIGPNGAGKSTLAKIVLGISEYDTGSRSVSSGLQMGYMPQSINIDPALPISTFRFLQLTSNTFSTCHEALGLVGIKHLAKVPVQNLSGGEMQRALLARAILNQPNLLVLDEPVQGVDITGQKSLYIMISKLAKDLNCAVLMISHDLHLVMSSTDHVICLNRHICCQGHPEQVTQDQVYLDTFGQTTAIYAHHHDHDHAVQADVLTEHSDHA
jgi:zinc transport system ATP-binding protein